MPLASTKTEPGKNRSPAGRSGRRPEVMSRERHGGDGRYGLVRPMHADDANLAQRTAHVGLGVEVLLVDGADLALAWATSPLATGASA